MAVSDEVSYKDMEVKSANYLRKQSTFDRAIMGRLAEMQRKLLEVYILVSFCLNLTD
jgi:hypothetical protein